MAKKNPGKFTQTSLGVEIQNVGESVWKIDLGSLRLFKGLSVLAQLLGDDLLKSLRANPVDVFVHRRVIEEITPELYSLGIENITIFSRQTVLDCLGDQFDHFQNYLRTVFGTLQRPKWGGVLFPEAFIDPLTKNSNTSKTKQKQTVPALLFPFYEFEKSQHDFYFLVERDIQAKLLRITIENQKDSRLNLNKIKSKIVNDLNQRTYLQGLTRISETIYQGILQVCENNSFEYIDNNRRHPHFFSQLERIGLKECETLTVRWPTDQTNKVLEVSRKDFINRLKSVFIILEDIDIVKLLNNQSILEVVLGDFRVYLDLSRRGRCLNVSFFEQRQASNLEYYLKRMPLLETLSHQKTGVFKNSRIVLIHHITGEILATIKALENMGVDFLHVLFVKYAGVVPADYLEVLMTLNSKNFHFTGLQKMELANSLDTYHTLSNQYSDIIDYDDLKNHLAKSKLAYFEAMRFSSAHIFMRESIHAFENQQNLVLIEDGGYLAPDLNQMCLENVSLAEALKKYKVDSGLYYSTRIKKELNKSLSSWLGKTLKCTIEHTRNGFNRLEETQKRFKKLNFPTGSIAISDIKRNRESEEVSVSILHAIESILHGLGFVLSTRKALVLGSRGAIGRNLIKDLSDRLGEDQVLGIDISSKDYASLKNLEVNDFSELSMSQIEQIDIVIGVIGTSILDKQELEKIILNNKNSKIYFASGSTKTVEFTGLVNYIQELQKKKNPQIAGLNVLLEFNKIRDPQTRGVVGSKVRIYFNETIEKNHPYSYLAGTSKELMLLGGLTPINFLFYGVPTETMDAVLSQLLELSCGMYEKIQKGFQYENRVLAVDRDIRPDGTILDT